MLNANARPFEPTDKMDRRVREAPLSEHAQPFKPVYSSDEHSLFLTFSNGFPLQDWQIFDFFNRSYAPNVERVIVPKPRRGSGPPLHGRVVFKNTDIPRFVMKGREKMCFSVDGLPFYCKKFVSKKTKPADIASTSHGDGGSHPGGDGGSHPGGDGGSHPGGDGGSHPGGDE